MFWNKKQAVVATKVGEVKKEELGFIIPTVNIINGAKVGYIDLLDRELNTDEAHLKKYLYALERNKPENTDRLDMYFITKMRKKDFRLLLHPTIIKNFKYAACVYVSYNTGFPPVLDDNNILTYVGDIPNFALDRIIDAQSVGISTITIHSNQELPIKYEKYIYRDPVLIGWSHNPRIRKNKNIWQVTNDNIGDVCCVIAMWGIDGQSL